MASNLTPRSTSAFRLPNAPPSYDQSNESQMRRAIETWVQKDSAIPSTSFAFVTPMNFGAVGDGTTDDSAAFNAAAVAVDAGTYSGIINGAVMIDREYFIDADITCTRMVNLVGLGGPTVAKLTATSARNLTVTGPALEWNYSISGIKFTKISVRLGNAITDECNGSIVQNCVIQQAQLYWGYNAFHVTAQDNTFVGCATGIFLDVATGDTTTGANVRIKNNKFFDLNAGGVAAIGIKIDMTGGGSRFASVFIEGNEFERLTEAAVKTIAANNRSVLYINDTHLELFGSSAYFIENAGALIYVNGFWSWSATETAWFSNSGGDIYCSRMFGNWTSGHFAKVTGGTIHIDVNTCETPSRYWGNGVQAMLATGSTTGGKIVGMASRYLAQYGVASTAMTNASPSATSILLAVPGDGNINFITFDVEVTAIFTDSILQVQLADGVGSPFVNLTLPLFVGFGHFEIEWVPGVSWTVSGVYSGSTPGATTTEGYYQTTADSGTLDLTKFLQFKSGKVGLTASSMQCKNIRQEVVAPYQATT